MFSHKYESAINDFIKISTNQSTIKLTADHYLYVNGRLAFSHTILAPIRMLYKLGIDVMDQKFNEGCDSLINLLPKGKDEY